LHNHFLKEELSHWLQFIALSLPSDCLKWALPQSILDRRYQEVPHDFIQVLNTAPAW